MVGELGTEFWEISFLRQELGDGDVAPFIECLLSMYDILVLILSTADIKHGDAYL